MIRSTVAAMCVVCATSLLLDAGDTAIPSWVDRFNSHLESLVERVAEWPESPAEPDGAQDVIVVSDPDPTSADAREAPVVIVEDASSFSPPVHTDPRRVRRGCVW